MVALHARSHRLVKTSGFASIEKFVLYLIHVHPYFRATAIARGKAVLDLGCNNGYGSEMLAYAAKSVSGCDVSERAITAAKALTPPKPIDFRVIDGITLPYADNSFDLVMCCQVIEHVVDSVAFLAELKRVMAPGGVAVFTTPNACIRLDPGMKPWNRFHVTEYTPTELQEFMGQHFPHVRLAGLFAADDIARVELERVDRKRIARRQGGKGASSPAEQVDDREAFIASYGVRDLYFGQEQLEASIDLAAVCALDGDALDAACSGLAVRSAA
ncbi:hypothetical protein GCM10009127_26010 [Alteraurantiacibacter aestuarii]